MAMRHFGLRGLCVAGLLLGGCGEKGNAGAKAAAGDPPAAGTAEEPVGNAEPASGETGGREKIDEAVADANAGDEEPPGPPPIAEKEPQPAPAQPTDVEQEDLDKYPRHYIPYPDKAVTAEARPVAWTEVTDLDEVITFRPVVSGVIGDSGGKTYTIGDDGKLVAQDLKLPTFETIIGRYPKDAWYVHSVLEDRSGESYQLRRWRGNGRWVAQDIGGDTERDGSSADLLAKGWRGGFLVGTQDGGELSFVRVAPAGAADPDPQPILEQGRADRFFETRSGRIYLFLQVGSGDEQTAIVQRSCSEEGCQRENARAFPEPTGEHSGWSFANLVPRKRHSVSGLATEYRRPAGAEPGSESTKHHWLVHYEAGGWKLERLPDGRQATRLWPVKDGGLWAMVDGAGGPELWHRDPQAHWSYAVLPEGVDASAGLQVAMPDAERLWLAAKVGDRYAVFETPGAAQNPPVPLDEGEGKGAELLGPPPGGETKAG